MKDILGQKVMYGPSSAPSGMDGRNHQACTVPGIPSGKNLGVACLVLQVRHDIFPVAYFQLQVFNDTFLNRIDKSK